ncbi:MAG: winged helix-turn-helix transcriptional regulator [Victivallales bacterium]|nr:winged helix-turn-helix transcriptional regulator [Victivallales bacterium]
MSILVRNENQSSQVARLIECDITSGKLPPNSRLRSTRDLARHFGVGQRVVLSALDILERKDLISRKPRSGIHVKAHGTRKDIKEILFFALANQVEFHPIVQAVNNLVNLPEANHKYNFLNRLVSSDSNGANYSLEAELARLTDWGGYVDCAILYPRGFTRKTVEQCLKLPYPVIFAGDLPEGDYEDLQYTRLASDTGKLFKTMIDYASGKKYRNLIFFSLAIMADFPFFVEAQEEMQKMAKACNIELRTELISGTTPMDMRTAFEIALKEHHDEIRNMDIIASYGIPHPDFDAGTLLAPLRFPEDIDMINLSPSSGAVKIRHIQRDSTMFCRKLCELLDNCNNSTPCLYRVPFDFEVI